MVASRGGKTRMSTAAARSIPRPTSGVDANAVLALIAVAQFMVVLDATIVNVALPTIKVDVGFSEQSLSWVLNAYTLIFGGFLLLGGRAAARLGRRRLFMAGIAVFSGASLRPPPVEAAHQVDDATPAPEAPAVSTRVTPNIHVTPINVAASPPPVAMTQDTEQAEN